MNVTLNLDPATEEGLRTRAEARGVSLDAYLQEVVAREVRVPVRPSIADKIRERMSGVPAEMLAALPQDGASEHDHYIYGLPKRGVSE
jgi:hypothetical protein